jgi:hypothetical protein
MDGVMVVMLGADPSLVQDDNVWEGGKRVRASKQAQIPGGNEKQKRMTSQKERYDEVTGYEDGSESYSG